MPRPRAAGCEQQEQAESRLMAAGSTEYGGDAVQTSDGRGAAPARLLRMGDAGVDMPHLARSFGAQRRQDTQARIEGILAAGTRAPVTQADAVIALSAQPTGSREESKRSGAASGGGSGEAREAQRPALDGGER